MNSIAIICLFIIIIVLRECASIPPPAPVIVNKCCRIGESLDENHQCNIGGDSNWWPIIFMMLKKSYFQPYGSAPRFFKIRERTHPYCQHQDYPIGMHSMALFSNGSLYLSEKHKFIEPHNFCVDKETAIICDPDNNTPDALMLHQKPIKIRKCCGKNAVYRTIENTCVPSNSFPTMEKLVYSSSSVDFVFAFPDCKISKYFTIAEKFNESNLDMGTGRLVLETGRKVDTKNFCLEHVFMNNIFNETSSVHVFTCADHLSIQSNQTADTSMVKIDYSIFCSFMHSNLFLFMSNDRNSNVCALRQLPIGISLLFFLHSPYPSASLSAFFHSFQFYQCIAANVFKI